MKQRFFKDDVVTLAATFPPEMEHFRGRGKTAIVMGSYKDQFGYGSEGEPVYTLTIAGEGEVSWYPQHLMTLLIGRNCCTTCGSRLGRKK